MHDARYVHLLIHTEQGEFLKLRPIETHPVSPYSAALPSGESAGQANDVSALDVAVEASIDLVLNTEDAIQIGFDAEYEPGRGLVTQVLYMLKIKTSRPFLRLDDAHEGYDWVSKDELIGFTPPVQVLVQTAVDFYL